MALNSAWKQMSWLYYQYLLVTALYMLEPWERTIFSFSLFRRPKTSFSFVKKTSAFCPYIYSVDHSMLVSILGMALYTGYVFMPQHIMAILHYFEMVQ